jgi:hypothetical protein
MTALASLGVAGEARATELCETSITPCSSGKYSSGTIVHAQLQANTVATLTTSIVSVTCPESTVVGKTTSSGGAGSAVTGEINQLVFSGHCHTSSGTTCEVESVNLPYTISLSGGGTPSRAKSTLNVLDPVGAGAYVKCGALLDCTFTTKSALLSVTNQAGGTPTLTAGVSLSRAGSICPPTATWDATYIMTTPDPVFVV